MRSPSSIVLAQRFQHEIEMLCGLHFAKHGFNLAVWPDDDRAALSAHRVFMLICFLLVLRSLDAVPVVNQCCR